MNRIVFSKNRGCQLDLFLRSMKKAMGDIDGLTVIWKADKEYREGYHLTMERHAEARWVAEDDFESDTREAIARAAIFTVFFVDDDVWTHEFAMDFEADRLPLQFFTDKKAICLSLRLGKNIRRSYIYQKPAPLPYGVTRGGSDSCIWDYETGQYSWGYPMSLDGHIFRTKDILATLDKFHFTCPNDLEGKMAQHPIPKKIMYAYPESRLFNIPCNRVQDLCPNRCGKMWTAQEIEQRYLGGWEIDLAPIWRYRNTSVHQEVSLQWRRR